MEPGPEETNDCPVEQVRLTVPITDDPTMPVLTFRTWVLGISSCAILAFLSVFFGYRVTGPYISQTTAILFTLPIGKLMAAAFPTKLIRIPATQWSFSMNPGPFNMKEHALIGIFAASGAGGVFGLEIVDLMKAYYRRELDPYASLLMIISSQVIGYGWAGMFKKFLVESPLMWWPTSLAQVSFYRALHEKEARPKRGLTRLQFFLVTLITSFCFYIFPGYLFQSLTSLSFVCWIWKDSVTAQQLGSGWIGFGLGSFSLDWSNWSAAMNTPTFALVNGLLAIILTCFILTPIGYWTNLYGAKRFPVFSVDLFDADGHLYNISRVLDEKKFQFNEEGYNNYSRIHLSIQNLITRGMGFASITCTLCHTFLFYGRSIWQETNEAIRDKNSDVHGRLMKKNYDSVPQWWFYVMLLLMVALSIFVCEGFGRQLQLPYWGVLLACAIAFLYTIPMGAITATSNMIPGGIMESTELIISYIYPGRPVANIVFKSYGFSSANQAIFFLQDFKLGHYMKIPPKSMFLVQLASTVISSTVNFATAWWLLTTVENICNPDELPEGSPWMCPVGQAQYSSSILWGLIGPRRIFGNLGLYSNLNFFFLIGLLAPFPAWGLSLVYPEKKWLKLINMPIILGGAGSMPPFRMAFAWTFYAVGFIFSCFVYRRFKGWWARHTYVLSSGLDAGIALFAVVSYLALQMKDDVYGINWWGLEIDDHCPLAQCPTEPGMVVDGCPVQ